VLRTTSFEEGGFASPPPPRGEVGVAYGGSWLEVKMEVMMKKFALLFICTFAALAACSSEQPAYDTTPTYEDAYAPTEEYPLDPYEPTDEYDYEYAGVYLPADEEELDEHGPQQTPRLAQPQYSAEVWPGWTREGFLEDIDYLMWVLEENFPFLGTIYRRFGADMGEKANQLREIVADESREIDAQIFYEMLLEYFFTYGGRVGHLWAISPGGYHDRRNVLESAYGHPNMPAINSPASIAFYGDPLTREEITEVYQRLG